jgi:hypothetical protein
MQLKVIQGIDAIREQRLDEARQGYAEVCAGRCPNTGAQIYVDCIVDGQTFRMNAGKTAAETFDSGIRLAERSGATSVTVVDFYDVQHSGISLESAQQINMQQSQDAQEYYFTYQRMKEQIRAVRSPTEVREVDLTFKVKTEPK